MRSCHRACRVALSSRSAARAPIVAPFSLPICQGLDAGANPLGVRRKGGAARDLALLLCPSRRLGQR